MIYLNLKQELNNIREKCGEYQEPRWNENSMMDRQDRSKNRFGMNNGFGSIDELARKDRVELPNSGDNDNGDQQEVEQLRKQMDKMQNELTDALQEAEVSKQRRDWVFAGQFLISCSFSKLFSLLFIHFLHFFWTIFFIFFF